MPLYVAALRSLLVYGLLAAFFSPPAAAQLAEPAPGYAAGGDTVRVSLGEALRRALAASPEVDQRQAQRRFAEARLGEARASRFLPEFELSTVHAAAPGLENVPAGADTDALYLLPEVENDWSDLRPFNAYNIDFGQPVWTWGELGGSIRAARYGVLVEEAETDARALAVALRAGETYFNVLLTEALSRLTERAGETVDRAQREVNRLLEEGDSSVDDADLFQLRITEQEFRRRVVEVEERRRLAASALARQLFLPEGVVATADTSVLAPLAFELDSLAFYTDLALRTRPEVEQARAGLAARNALVEVARSDYYPKLFLGGSFGSRYAAGRFRQESAYVGDPFVGNTTQAAFSVRMDLNLWRTRARVEQAEAERNEVRFQQEAAGQLIRFEVEEAYRNVRIAEAALAASDTSLQISGEWLRVEQLNFDFGFGEPENLVSATQADLELQAAYYEAVRDYNVTVLRLLRAVGVLATPDEAGILVDL